jgi:anti-anti-sigma factor
VRNHQEAALVIVGELDLESADEVQSTISAELRVPQVTEIVLDLRRVDFIDSAGLRVLLALRNDGKRNGHALTLIPPAPTVRRLFAITGTRGLFDWRGDRGDP